MKETRQRLKAFTPFFLNTTERAVQIFQFEFFRVRRAAQRARNAKKNPLARRAAKSQTRTRLVYIAFIGETFFISIRDDNGDLDGRRFSAEIRLLPIVTTGETKVWR